MHKNKTNNKLYIGITSRIPEKRWGHNGCGYKKTFFYNAIQKYGWDNFDHIIIAENLTKEEAEAIEVELIAKYDTTNKENGYNIQAGGNSIGKMTDEIKRKISKANTGKCVGEKNPNYGKPCPEKRMLAAIKANSKPVYQYDRNTGEYIAKYSSIKEASLSTGISSQAISGVCSYRHKSIGGFIFRHACNKFVEGVPLPDEYFEKSKNTRFRKIAQYSLDGEFIKEYKSIKDAENEFGYKQGATGIWHCCKGIKPTALGFKWGYI